MLNEAKSGKVSFPACLPDLMAEHTMVGVDWSLSSFRIMLAAKRADLVL